MKVFIPSGAGAPGFAGIFRCLKENSSMEVYAGDADADAYGKGLADHFFHAPASNTPAYAEWVINKAAAIQADVILPITTRELPILAEMKDQLHARGIAIPLTDAENLRIANHKGRLYSFLRNRGHQVPVFWRVNALHELKAAIQEAGRERRLFMKPAEGNGSRGVAVIEPESLEGKRDFLNEKPGAPHIGIADLDRLLPNTFTGEMLLSEFLPGKEFSVDVLANHGDVLYGLCRSRDKMSAGISVRGCFVRNEDILQMSRSFVKALHLHGPVGLQFRENAQGRPLLLEINPRLQGTVSSCLGAGMNLPLDAVRLAMGQAVRGRQEDVRWGVHFARHWSEVFW
jgi:carbamoyl-phosphate synthase large subunit